MPFERLPTRLAGLIKLKPAQVHHDARGWLAETFAAEEFRALGIDASFPLEIQSLSKRGTVRGLHFADPPEVKLVRCARGRIWDVAVDLRPTSPTFGQWEGHALTGEGAEQLFFPVGFAHGFSVLSEEAVVHYKLGNPYAAGAARSVLWNDPDLAVDWQIEATLISDRDRASPTFRAWRASREP